MVQDIIYQDKVVGTAKIEREGMFLIIQCQCSIMPTKPREIKVRSEKTELDLGLCTAQPHGSGLLIRIHAAKFPKEPVRFCLEDVFHKQFIPIRPETPLPSVEILQYARFAVENGIPGIITTSIVQSPDPQGNDLTP